MSSLSSENCRGVVPKNVIQVDCERPGCSKSLVKELNQVPAVPTVKTDDEAAGELYSTEISSNNTDHYYLPDQNNFGLAFSDTILTIIPKLPQIEEPEQNEEDVDIENNLELWNQEDDDIQVELPQISRKPPMVSFNIDEQYLNDISSKASSQLANDFENPNRLNFDTDFFDFNNNIIKCSSSAEKKLIECASYLFHKDRRDHLANTLSLLPRGREYVVLNVFHDLAKLFGFRGRNGRKHVAFPEEVMMQYEEKGDVAGKDRFVPTAKTPLKGIPSAKKRKLSAVYSSWSVKEADFVPRIDRIDDYSRCEHFCERKCIASDCCTGNKKPDLASVMEGYLSDLNVASLFVNSHTSRTFECALNTLEYSNLRRFSSTTLHYAKQTSKNKLGMLSCSIWVFGYCIRSILQQAMDAKADNALSLPSEAGFRKLIEQFATICLTMMESVKIVLQYSHNFYNFCKECIRILRVIQIHVGFPAEFKLNPPLKRGGGIKLNRVKMKRDILKQKVVKVMITKSSPPTTTTAAEEEEEVIEWKSYEELNGYDKVSCLRNLLHITADGITLVQTQLRFLLDDIVDSVKDITEADLLFILADMHDRIKFLENCGSKHTKAEMEQIAHIMTDFCKDFQAFVDMGQQIMRRFIEIRDIIHITYEFLVKGLRLDTLNEMLPTDAFRKKFTCFGFCGRGVRSTKRIVEKHQPKYQPLDFFRVYFDEPIAKNVQIFANKYQITLTWGETTMNTIYPLSKLYNWGEIAGSPHDSFEEYAEPETDDEQTEIKPILVESGKPGHGSPRGSITSNDSGAETVSSPQ